MKESPKYFTVLEIETHLKKLTSEKKKVKYLIELLEEFKEVCYYYNDYDIEKYITRHNLTNKYKRERYNRYADFEQTHINNSEYRKFLRHIDSLLQFVRSQMNKLKIKPKLDDNKISKDYKIFNYDTQQVLDYSNGLGKEKIPYLLWILQDYYRNTLDNINNMIPIPVIKGKYISPESSVISSEFFIKVHQRLQILKENPNNLVFNSYNEAMKYLKKIKLEDINAKNKDLCGFNFDKIKEHANNMKNPNERLLYLQRVKKEEAQIKGIIKKDFLGLSFEEKLNAEIEYVKEEIRVKSNNNIITENNERKQATENITIKTNEEYEKEIEYLRKKLITPKRYDIPELAEYYLKVAKKVRTKPSLRELEKGSDYNKDKWQKKIYNDVEFVMTLIGKLEKEKDKLPEKLYKELFREWTEKLSEIQKKDRNIRNKSKAKEYKENIGTEEE